VQTDKSGSHVKIKTTTINEPTGCDVTLDVHNAVILNSLHIVDDYPHLASVARQITNATRLDGRACRHIYMTALHTVKWNDVSPPEQQFMAALGVLAKK
jgi:hypothetical protein